MSTKSAINHPTLPLPNGFDLIWIVAKVFESDMIVVVMLKFS